MNQLFSQESHGLRNTLGLKSSLESSSRHQRFSSVAVETALQNSLDSQSSGESFLQFSKIISVCYSIQLPLFLVAKKGDEI